MPARKPARPVPMFLEVYREGYTPPSSKDDDLYPKSFPSDDPNVTVASVYDVASSPALQKRAVNRRQLRAILRELRAAGHAVVV